MRMTKRLDNTAYWEYIILYVNDYLAISMNPQSIIKNEIVEYFQMKKALLGEPDIYLGEIVRKILNNPGVEFWVFTLLQYIQGVYKTLRRYLKKVNGDNKSRKIYWFMSLKLV